MKAKPTTPEVLTARRQVSSEEAAEFLGISIRKLEKYRREGDGPAFVRLSYKMVRYRICDLLEFQDLHLQRNNTELSAA